MEQRNRDIQMPNNSVIPDMLSFNRDDATLLAQYGPFANLIRGSNGQLPAYLILKGMYDQQAVQHLLDNIQTALSKGESEFWIQQLLDTPDWRSQIIAATTILMLEDSSPYIEALWSLAIQGSWMSPQIMVVLSIIDSEFLEHCRNRIQCNCEIHSPEGMDWPEKQRSMGPAPDHARAGKEAAVILALCGQRMPAPDWLLKAKEDSNLIKIIASDIDGGGHIAVEWQQTLYEQFRVRGINLSSGKKDDQR